MDEAALELDLLRTLAAIHDAGGFSRAAARLGRTQSAVSLQVRRLEAAAGAPLFERRGRASVLTGPGEVLLHYARRLLALEQEALGALGSRAGAVPVGIGCAQDFAETWLPPLLARFTGAHPRSLLDARVDRNAALVKDVESGELDMALTLADGRAGPSEVLGALPLAWIAARDFRPPRGAPLPLALLSAPCPFRERALRALDRAGLPWRIVFTSLSLPGLWAAVRAGLALTVRTREGLPAGLRVAETGWKLPALGQIDVVLHLRTGVLPAPAQALAEMLREEAASRLPAGPARMAAGRSGRRRATRASRN